MAKYFVEVREVMLYRCDDLGVLSMKEGGVADINEK